MKSKVIQDYCDNFARTTNMWDGNQDNCKMCNTQINLDVFAKDPIGLKEYYISGLCDICQTRMYR